MKNIIYFCFLILLSSPASSGWLWDLAKVGAGVSIGAGIAKGMQSREDKIISNRVDEANKLLWDMHVLGEYEDNYKELLDYINESKYPDKSVGIADTVAWVYFDKKNYKKSLETYKKKIIPWISKYPYKEREKYKNNYENIKKVEACLFVGCSGLVENAIKNSYGKKDKDSAMKKSKRKALFLMESVTDKIKEVKDN